MINWHAIYTKPRSEKKVAERLSGEDFEVYCPMIKTLRQWSDRKKKVLLPLFPGYVFVRVSKADHPRVLQDYGVLNFVYWLGKPAIVRENEIAAIKEIALHGNEINITHDKFEKGQLVTIPDGPFKGLSGKIDKLDKRKIIVLVEKLGYTVSFNYHAQ